MEILTACVHVYVYTVGGTKWLGSPNYKNLHPKPLPAIHRCDVFITDGEHDGITSI